LVKVLMRAWPRIHISEMCAGWLPLARQDKGKLPLDSVC
jgi:hypothetical protein